MAKLVLFYTPITCSLVPYITLTEAGAEFEVRTVNLRAGEHTSPDFRRINPKGAVPVLLVDDQPLTENVAILIWIARHFPRARLLPADPWLEIKTISFLAWCASGVHPRLTPNALPQRYCDVPGTEENVRQCAQRLLRNSYALAEEQFADSREWFFQDFTAADAYFFWCFRRGGQFGVDLSEFPRCTAHLERIQRRPSVQKLIELETTVLQRFAGTNYG
jgi:glutathione S-transferase